MRRALPLGRLLILAFALSAVGAAPSHATFPGANGRLIYQAPADGHVQLFSIGADGRGFRQLTHLVDSDAVAPEWSQDGTRVVFARDFAGNKRGEYLDIVTMNPDGSGMHALGLHGLNGDPNFGPDGAIAWAVSGGLSIRKADGTSTMIAASGDNGSPVFSPDGKQIAFTHASGGPPAIYVVGADGTHLRRLTAPAGGVADKIDWSPDGSRIVFSAPAFGGTGRSSNLFTVRVDGTGLKQLTHANDGVVNNGADSWSPDGKEIAFVSNRSGTYQIWVMGADGTHVRQLTRGGEAHRAAWGART